MFTKKQVFFLHALSSVHAGSGSEVGLVDLPIQREKHTGFPKIESSSLKGAIRSTVRAKKQGDLTTVELIFGNEPKKGESDEGQAGAISLSDARILLFPVKSMRGVFAWITCPHVLKRIDREMKLYGEGVELPDFASLFDEVGSDLPKAAVSSDRLLMNGKLVLDEYLYDAQVNGAARELAQKLAEWLFGDDPAYLTDRLAVLADDDFRDFVQMFTEVNARIHVDEKKGTVQDGQLWYEENVPPESVFYAILFAGDVREGSVKKIADGSISKAQEALEFMKNEENFPEVFQLGGNSTIGKGLLRRIWL